MDALAESTLALLNEAVIVVDAHGALAYFNSEAERWAGRELAAYRGRPWAEAGFPAVIFAALERSRLDAARSRSAVQGEEALFVDGERFDLAYRAAPTGSRETPGDQIVIVARDVTELRSAEREQTSYRERERRANQRFRAIAEASRVFAEAGLDLRKAFDVVVRHVAELMGDGCALTVLSDSGAMLEPVALHHPDAEARALMEKLFARPFRTDEGLIGWVFSSGEVAWFPKFDAANVPASTRAETLEFAERVRPHSVVVVPVRGARGTIGALAIARNRPGPAHDAADVHLLQDLANRAGLMIENAKLYRAAHDASRLKDEFLATVSHELRTPLTSMLGWAKLLQQGTLDEAQRARAIDAIERNARVQAQLVDDILDASRIILGKLQVMRRKIDARGVVNAAVDVVRPAADAKRVELHIDLGSEPRWIVADQARLQQIVWNLLSNAVKFTPTGGKIELCCIGTDGALEIACSDNGEGIPAEFLPHVFDRFRQADGSLTRTRGGLGLGLAIVRHLVELHGGTVTARSDGAGKGASFVVRLPQSTDTPPIDSVRPPPLATADDEPSLPLYGLRIVTVDDDEDTSLLLASLLTGQGARVTAVSNAIAALAAIEREPPDLLVSDLAMPDHDGYWLIRQVRALPIQRGGGVPALAFSALARREDSERSLREGFQMHLTKPIAPERLVPAVQQLAHRRSGHG